MPSPTSPRRPVDLTPLDAHPSKMKLCAGVVLSDTRKRTISLPRDVFVPILQADDGSAVSVSVYRHRLLVPIAQIIRESAHEVRRVSVAAEADIFTIRNALIRHFGGVTVLHQLPAPAFGVGLETHRMSQTLWNRMNTSPLKSTQRRSRPVTIIFVLFAASCSKHFKKALF
jgi:hypothetical protein